MPQSITELVEEVFRETLESFTTPEDAIEFLCTYVSLPNDMTSDELIADIKSHTKVDVRVCEVDFNETIFREWAEETLVARLGDSDFAEQFVQAALSELIIEFMEDMTAELLSKACQELEDGLSD